MANPLGGLLAPGFGSRLAQGFQDNSGMLSTIGAGLLAHRQNANNPMFGDPRMLMLAQQADQERQEEERQRQKSLAKDTATREFAINELGFDLPTVDALAASGQLGPVVMDEVAKRRAPPPAPEWKVVGNQLVKIDPSSQEPEWYGPGGAGGIDPEEAFKREDALRDDYRADPAYKRYDEINSAYRRIRESVSSDSGPGDLGVIFGYMKLLDPNSTVRETEFANAENATGIPESIRNIWNKVKTGERLTPTQRREFAKAAHQLYLQEAETMKGLNSQYGSLAERYQVDPGNVAIRGVQEYDPLDIPDPLGIR